MDGKIECLRCGTYAPCTDLCAGGCGVVAHIGTEPGCKGDPAYHQTKGAGMGGGFVAYYDEHVCPPPSEHFRPNFTLPDFHPEKGYLITSLADQRRMMRVNHMEKRSHKGRTEF